MPRARNIKPGFFTDAKLGRANPLLMVLFASLWCIADREGRLKDDPEDIWVYTFPFRPDVKTDELLNELQTKGYIIRYKVDGQKVIQVTNFKKHQSPHKYEKASTLPAFDDKALIIKEVEKSTVEASVVDGISTVVKRPDSLIPDSLIPDCGYLIQKHIAKPSNPKNTDCDFEDAWKMYPRRPGANKTQALKAWNARLKEGVEVHEMQDGILKYRKYCEQMRIEPQYIKQAATFLGPDKHFLNDWKSSTKADKFDDWLNGPGEPDVIDI